MLKCIISFAGWQPKHQKLESISKGKVMLYRYPFDAFD
jgi:hypothetical protein